MEIIETNPAFELYDPAYLLNPTLLAQNRQMTSINSATRRSAPSTAGKV